MNAFLSQKMIFKEEINYQGRMGENFPFEVTIFGRGLLTVSL